MRSNLADIEVYIHHETEKAWLVSVDGETKVWIPKSQADLSYPASAGDTSNMVHILTAPERLLIEKGLV